MRVTYAPVHQELVRLGDGGYLAPLHRLLQLLPGFFGDELLGTALIDPADQEFPLTASSVSGEPSLALTPAVAQSLRRLREVGTLSRLQQPQHPHSVKQVAVAMALLKLLELFDVFLNDVWIIYLWHGHIMSLVHWIRISDGEVPGHGLRVWTMLRGNREELMNDASLER